MTILLFILLGFTFAQNCSFFTDLASQYSCNSSSFLQSFGYTQCLKNIKQYSTFQNKYFILNMNTCVIKYINDSINTITNLYNNQITCQDINSIGLKAYQYCFMHPQNNLISYCELSNSDKFSYLRMAYQNITNQGLVYWDNITNKYDGITKQIINVLGSIESRSTIDYLKKQIQLLFINQTISGDIQCSNQYALNYLISMIGNYNNLKGLNFKSQINLDHKFNNNNLKGLNLKTQFKQNLTFNNNINGLNLKNQLKNLQPLLLGKEKKIQCSNYTNQIIQNQTNLFISMTSCSTISFTNVTIRNNINIRFSLSNSGAVVLNNVTIQNTTSYGLTGGLFSLSSTSCNIYILNVTNYKGNSVISMIDGSISISNALFSNITIDSLYSFSYGTIFMIRGSIALSYSTFNNITSQFGAGVYFNDGSMSVAYSNFYNMSSRAGAGIFFIYGSLSVSYTKFQNNKAGLGAAIYGAYSNAILTQISINNCISNHGNLYFLNSSIVIQQSCDFSQNIGIRGSAVYVAYSDITIQNYNIFQDNKANQYSSINAFVSNVKILNFNTFKNNIQNTSSSVGFSYTYYYLDSSNSFINDTNVQSCTSNCNQCVFDQVLLQYICNGCYPGFYLNNYQCMSLTNISKGGAIALFTLSTLTIIGGSIYLCLKYKSLKKIGELGKNLL